MSRNIHVQHQRSSSTGSHGLLFGIGAAAGPHHVINHHAPITHQISSPSTDPLTDEDEDSIGLEDTEALELKGTLSKWTNYIHGWQDRYFSLKEGTLVYYKSQLETDFGCRGAITIDKATIKSHDLDEMRFDVSVSDCVWYLRATSIEDRQRWIDALEVAKRRQHPALDHHSGSQTIGRYDSAMSLSSTSSVRKSAQPLKEKLAEMETFKDILSQQIDKLGAHIDLQSQVRSREYEDSSDFDESNQSITKRVNNHESAERLDFRAEAITFKATANGILFSLANCIETLSRSEETWRKKLEKEQIARKRAEELYRKAIEEAEPVKPETPSKPSQMGIMKSPDYEEGPNSQIGEDEFFDAVETALDKLQEEQELRDKLKELGAKSSEVASTSASEAMNHPLWDTIDSVTNEQLHYARLQVGQDSIWELFAEDGEMKMYKREEEIDGMVIDPLKALHQVTGKIRSERDI